MKHFEVCAAVITRENDSGKIEVFSAKRPGPKEGKEVSETNFKWEFPGGKIEKGETRQVALEREIREEFNTQISVGEFITTVNHQYKDFSITMHAFFCKLISGTLQLQEHLDSKWLFPEDLSNLDWAAADIPIMEKVKEKLENL